uniref:GDT1 family protein n=1 Tax=Rhabditophanes sp. KR3021 TaxID=114890 RepID=A0AC35UEP3_9BILA
MKHVLSLALIGSISLFYVYCDEEAPPLPTNNILLGKEHIDLVQNANQLPEESQDNGFVSAFTASFLMILASEIGDKTFFIAAIMSMTYSRIVVFSGAIGALAVMTVLSVFLGWITQIVPRIIVFWFSTALFFVFGVQGLWGGYKMSPNEGAEELEEAQAEVQKSELDLQATTVSGSLETGNLIGGSNMKKSMSYTTLIFMKAFSLTFLAEFGDRSQISTIALGAVKDASGVIIGGIAGHCICTGIAVIGSKFLAMKVSVRAMTIIGGITFIAFAIFNIASEFFWTYSN